MAVTTKPAAASSSLLRSSAIWKPRNSSVQGIRLRQVSSRGSALSSAIPHSFSVLNPARTALSPDPVPIWGERSGAGVRTGCVSKRGLYACGRRWPIRNGWQTRGRPPGLTAHTAKSAGAERQYNSPLRKPRGFLGLRRGLRRREAHYQMNAMPTSRPSKLRRNSRLYFGSGFGKLNPTGFCDPTVLNTAM